ncbi:MAG TPA: T9SS type A sorting domain-containing protein, partial [Bacteroidetes bacterium]|nr:T9SS type A sorting domain-containing protein [Bacteroidota bacterium]
ISDRTVAAPWNYYLRNSGVFVDNILLADDDNDYLFYDGEQDPVPDDMIPRRGPGFGDFWELSDESSHSGDWSAWNDDDHFNLQNALDTPPFDIPEGLTVWYEFWVWCDVPDYDSNGDNRLEDFYQMYVSNDEGESWEYITHDYARAESGGDDWFHYVPGTPWTGNVELDLTDYENETIQLRWLFYTDNDHGDGNGDGIFIDDLEVVGVNRNLRDVGMENLHLPYPTTVGMRRTGFSVDCHNYGLRDQDNIYARWKWGDDEVGRTYPIIPRPDIVSGDFMVIDLSDYVDRNNPGWTPTVPGVFDVTTFTELGANTQDEDDDDENLTNDTARVTGVRVWPSGMYELGHDNRTYRYALNFDRGQGAAARFSPADDGIEDYSLAAAHFRFNGAQDVTTTFRLHVLGEGGDNAPGEELVSFEVDVPVDSCLPNNMTVPLYAREELQGLNGDFWIWIEIMREDYWPQIIGDELIRGEGWYFNHDGENTVPFERDMLIHPIIVSTGEVEPNLAGSEQRVEFNEVYVGESLTLGFSLYSIGLQPVTIENVTSSNEAFTVDWRDEVTLAPGEAVTFDITYAPPDDNEHEANLVIQSNDESPPSVILIGFGATDVEDPGETMPVVFELDEPYPNPFNSLTRIDYSLESPGDASLVLYDLSGRKIRTIVQGWIPAGRHITALKAENLPTGVYLLKLEAGNKTAVRKVALLR